MPDPDSKPEHASGTSGPDDAAAPQATAEPPRARAEGAASSGAAGEGAAKLGPDAIAARIQSIGEEDEIERIASAEEKKLLERRDEQRKKKGKSGLETAASKRLAKIGDNAVKRPQSLAGAVSPDMDPLVSRAFDAQKWIKENSQLFAALVAVAVLGLGGFLGWNYWQDKRNADASAMLARAFADEHGHISDTEPDDDEETLTKELYPTFKTPADRRDAAIAQCRAVESKYAGTGAAILARLSEGSLLLDADDAKGALAAYEDVKASPLAKADPEVRGRAIEGIGFADELLAQGEGADRAKHLDDALAAYHEMAGVDAQGIKELGLYHQARVLLAKGDKAKAIDLLKEAHKQVSDPSESHAFPYLEFVVEDRLRELDPSALPPKPLKMPGLGGLGEPGGGAGMPNLDDPKIQELLRQLKAKQNGAGAPPPVPAPAPAQSAP